MIKKRIIVFSLLIIFILIANNNLLSSESDEYSEFWFKFYYTAQQGKTNDAVEIIDELSNSKIQKNHKIEILYLIWNYSLDKIKKGNYKEGMIYLEQLNKNFKNNWMLVDDLSALKSKHYKIWGTVLNNLQELKDIIKNNFFLIFNPLINAMFFAFVISFAVFILFKYIDNFKLILNDLGRKKFSITLFIMFLLITPAFLLGLFYIPFGLAGIIVFYFSKKEKNLLLIFYILLFLIFSAMEVSIFFDSVTQNSSYQTINKLNSGLYKDGELKSAEQLYFRNKDEQLGIVIAMSYYNDNKLFNAKEILEKMNMNSSLDEKKYLLLGNIYYKVGFFALAKDMYNKALSLNPNNPIINHNLGILLMKINQIESAQKFLKSARTKGIKRGNEIIVNIPKPKLNYFRYTNVKLDFDILYNPLLLAIIVSLFFMLLSKLIFRSIGESIKCEFCGRPTIKNTRVSKRDYCQECFNLFVIKDPLLIETRKIKYKEIDDKNRKRSAKFLLLSLIIPGLDFIEKRYTYTYFIFSTLFYTFIFMGLFLYNNIKIIKFSNISGIHFIFVIIAFMLYFFMNLTIYFIEKREWL
jgi:tetratricopeptide (TPR) repeat protein